MKTLQSAATLLTLVCSASAGITFGHVRVQPGESVRLVTHSETAGGTITSSSSKAGESTKAELPIRLVATKSFIRDSPMP